MRKFVFLFSFIFLFVQSVQNASAFAPLVGVAGATLRGGGVVLTKGATGAKILKGVNTVFQAGVITWCLKNQKKCLDLGGDVAEDIINAGDDDKTSCIVRFGGDKLTMSAFISSVSKTEDRGSYTIKYYSISSTTSELKRYQGYALDQASGNDWSFINGQYPLGFTTTDKVSGDTSDGQDTYYVSVWYKCGASDNDKSEDLFDAIKDKVSDDEAKEIINNYYNETENTFNIEKYCATSNACLDIDNDFSKELNTKDYDYTKISKENCELENDKIVSCEKAKKTKLDDDDDSDNINRDDKKDKDDDSNDINNSDNTNKKDDDSDNQKIKCNSSEFHKKVCDFIDWYQDDDLNADDDTKVKVKDLSDDLKIDDDRIKFGYSCPVPDSFSFSLFSKTFTYSISYNGLCDSFLKLRPFIIALSYIIGGMIVLGRKI